MKGQEIKGRLDRIGKTTLEHFEDIKELEVADEQGLTVKDIVPYKCKQVEKSLKALDIIKEKYVHIPQLLCAFENQLEEENPLEVYYNGQVGINVPMPLTEEEFNLLKEVLEWATLVSNF